MRFLIYFITFVASFAQSHTFKLFLVKYEPVRQVVKYWKPCKPKKHPKRAKLKKKLLLPMDAQIFYRLVNEVG